MRASTIRAWVWVHKWTSLVCTIFLLMLCLTGLPLIFHDEIDGALNREALNSTTLNPTTGAPADPGAPFLSLDRILEIALARRPGEVPVYMSFDVDRPVVNVTTAPTASASDAEMHFASFYQAGGAPAPQPDVGAGVMEFLLRLHTDMFLGLPGMLFLGLMGGLFVASIVSGIVVYRPFMAKLDFGTVRRAGSARTRWLDYHNLLGITATGWLLVVGLTGVVNTLEEPIISAWRENELADLISRKDGAPLVSAPHSLDVMVEHAIRAAPDMELQFVAFPGSLYSTDAHYAVFFHGGAPATKRIITPVLVSAADGAVEGLRRTPLPVTALSLSRPLHFGDYGGLFLKVVWAFLDVIAIVILGSGVYLWLAPERRARRRERESLEAPL